MAIKEREEFTVRFGDTKPGPPLLGNMAPVAAHIECCLYCSWRNWMMLAGNFLTTLVLLVRAALVLE